MKKILKYIGVIFIVLIFFRGFLYRNLISYSKVNTRTNIILTNKNIIKVIDENTKGKTLNIEEIIALSNKITSNQLNFTFDKVSSNPNTVFELKQSNCTGYASLFNAIGNYLIKKQKMTNTYECIHLVGKLDVLGFNIHNLFKNSFYSNHDFNEIKNKLTGEKRFVDPSLRDYLRIETVTSK